MTSNKKNTIEDKVWRYIRREKRFIFSDVMIVTGITQEYLLDLLKGYESKEIIKLSNKKVNITNRQYIVLQKLDIKEGVVKHSKKDSKNYGRRVEVHKIEHFISVKDYKKSTEYRQRIRVIKLLDKKIDRSKLVTLSKVSAVSVKKIVNENYPNPQKMLNRIVQNLGFDLEKLNQVRTNLDVKDFVRSYQNGNKK